MGFSRARTSHTPATKEASPRPNGRMRWWTAASLRRKIIILALLFVLLAALIIGLAVGLTIGRSGGGGEGGNEPTPTYTFTPLPTPTAEPKWKPSVNDTWQIVLQNPIELSSDATSVTPDASIYDIDLFTNSNETIDTLHRLGKKVICYFSAGSYEPNRPDSQDFYKVKGDLGLTMEGWPDEKWLNLNSSNVRSIMEKRIALAAQKGCDAVDPDNVDGYSNKNGLNLTPYDSINFLAFLSNVTTTYNLSLGLKNAGDIIPAVLPITHFQVNEQCVENDECTTFSAYINASKPVFHIEYPKSAPSISSSDFDKFCGDSGDAEGTTGFSTVLKNMDLDGFVEYCDKSVATTATNSSSSSKKRHERGMYLYRDF